MTLHRAPDQSEIVCRDLILLQHRKNGLERAAERSCKIFGAENRAVESLHQVHELLHLLGRLIAMDAEHVTVFTEESDRRKTRREVSAAAQRPGIDRRCKRL